MRKILTIAICLIISLSVAALWMGVNYGVTKLFEINFQEFCVSVLFYTWAMKSYQLLYKHWITNDKSL